MSKYLEITLLVGSFVLLGSPLVFSDETISEKAGAIGNNVKRTTKKGIHRTQGALCMKGSMECKIEKLKN